MQMKGLRFKLQQLSTTGVPYRNDSTSTEPLDVRPRKTNAVYQKSPIKLYKTSRKEFDKLEKWFKRYKYVAKANDWTNQRAVAALPACLMPWPVQEFESVPRKYIENVPGELASTFETFVPILKPNVQQYRSPGATRSEFKSVRQYKNKFLKE